MENQEPRANPNDDFLPTRRSLLSRLKRWDEQESWAQFFHTYWRLIYAMARKAGLNDAEAQDVVQETVLAVAKTMPKFEYRPELCSFKSWLHHLTRCRIADHLRKRPPWREADRTTEARGTATVDRVPDPSGDLSEKFWEEEWQRNLMAAALDRVKLKVNAKQYQIFDLYAVKHWSASEVARVLRVNVGRVYLARHRVTRLIREEIRTLEQEGY